ncbi:hypothetical protein CYMTET_8873 [Cymbomonas tetramitiformis]|uniref:Uncharacterized protein n=1 Tax=Cymbomonas tetramitiformis TaxID=36881 RepID=A0AAE0GSF4_9CHLO|nr:hypothetical protein CYMTET_8873 [Cymbomonas tetramitiformis]
MIYLHSSKYARKQEFEVPGTSLFFAQHRKLTDAYILSRKAAVKILESGVQEAIMPWDDFVPALYSSHPRRDVEALACIQKVRNQGFIALCFARDDVLSVNAAKTVGSDSNYAPCILGDYGVFLPIPQSLTEGGCKRFSMERLMAGDLQGIGRHLESHSYAILIPDADSRKLFTKVEEEWLRFFTECSDNEKRQCKVSQMRDGQLMLHSGGYTRQVFREQFHLVCGAWELHQFHDKQLEESNRLVCEVLKKLCIRLLGTLMPRLEEKRQAAYMLRYEHAARICAPTFSMSARGAEMANACPGSLQAEYVLNHFRP